MFSSRSHRSTWIGAFALTLAAACTSADVGDASVQEVTPAMGAALDRSAALRLVTTEVHVAGLRMVDTDAPVPASRTSSASAPAPSPVSAAASPTGAGVAGENAPRADSDPVDVDQLAPVPPGVSVPDGGCGCEAFDVTLDAPLRRAVGVTWRADPEIEPVTIGPVVAVFGDSITHGEGSPGSSWVEQLAELNPDLEVRNLARFGMTLHSWPWNNMVAHTAEGGIGRSQLDGVDTVVYVTGFNDFHHIGGEVDRTVQALHDVAANLEAAPIDHFFLLPMLPVGERWAVRTEDPGPGGPVMEWIDEFNRRVVADGIAVPFDPGFDLDGDPSGFGDPEIYDGFENSDPTFSATDGVDGVHPGPLGHRRLAERVDELFDVASTLGIPNVGRGADAIEAAVQDG